MKIVEAESSLKGSKEYYRILKSCKEEWSKITANVCIKLVSSYGKSLDAVLENKGYCTK